MIIWLATTHRSKWTTFPTPGWHYACSESGYTDSKISFEWLKRVFEPQTKGHANGKPRVLICDGFGTHETLEILELCFENNITLCRLPSHTSHKLQPCDIGVFAPLKSAYRDEVERLFRGGVNTVGREHFTLLYSPARDKAFTKRNTIAAWAATGLFPLNPDRVIRRTPKPPTQLNIPRPNKMRRSVGLPDEVPESPTTPVSAEAFMSLYNLIKEDTYTLDETGRQRLQRRVQKLAKAGQSTVAYCSLLEDERQSLIKINNEAKVRRSTKSVVLGKAKVMSFEDIEVARAARSAKDIIKGKGKGGRKRKTTAPDEPTPEPELAPEPETAHAAKQIKMSIGKRRRKRTTIVSEADKPEQEPEPMPVSELAQIITPPETWSVPVAKMY
jgi:hypothetical protein